MISKTKTAFVAAFILGTASAAMAQAGGDARWNTQHPNMQRQHVQAPSPRLFEGRNVYEGRGLNARAQIAPDFAGPQFAQPNPYSYNYSDANRSPLESFGGY